MAVVVASQVESSGGVAMGDANATPDALARELTTSTTSSIGGCHAERLEDIQHFCRPCHRLLGGQDDLDPLAYGNWLAFMRARVER